MHQINAQIAVKTPLVSKVNVDLFHVSVLGQVNNQFDETEQ